MTEQAQRIAIAEACGYWFHKESLDLCTSVYDGPPPKHKFLGHIGGEQCGTPPIPDYLNDLNACHEMEKALLFSGRQRFRKELQEVMSQGIDGPGMIAIEECIHATAKQRAEAFLKAKGLWRDE